MNAVVPMAQGPRAGSTVRAPRGPCPLKGMRAALSAATCAPQRSDQLNPAHTQPAHPFLQRQDHLNRWISFYMPLPRTASQIAALQFVIDSLARPSISHKKPARIYKPFERGVATLYPTICGHLREAREVRLRRMTGPSLSERLHFIPIVQMGDSPALIPNGLGGDR